MLIIALSSVVLARQTIEPHAPTAKAIAPADVSDRVLALIRKLQSECSDAKLIFTTFKELPASRGQSPQIVASVIGHFRQPGSGYVDLELARRYAIDLFACYGISLETNVSLTSPSARLDGFNQDYGLGFRLRERMTAPGVIEDRSRLLDWDEVAALAELGIHVQILDQERTDESHFGCILAVVATLVSFLNDRTDGPIVDLSPAIWRGQERLTIDGAGSDLAAPKTEPRTLVFRINEHTERVELWSSASGQTIDRPLSTAGMIGVLVWSIGKLPWRVVQPLADGSELTIETHGSVVFTPPTFDAAKPFRLEVDLAPGASATVPDALFLGAPARRN
jgi:hypothetical protein